MTELLAQLRWFVVGWMDHVPHWWFYVGGPMTVALGAGLGWAIHELRDVLKEKGHGRN